MSQIAILILAAGASSRMDGEDKLMKDANGAPLLARVIARSKATGLPVFVTVPDLSHPRSALGLAQGCIMIAVPDWHLGMAASIRAGIKALPAGTPGAMILPGDMPDLQTDDLHFIAQAATSAPNAIIRATTSAGTPGHPVIFPASLFRELMHITGDQGARAVIVAHKTRVIEQAIPGENALIDLDTPTDWAAWQAAQKQ